MKPSVQDHLFNIFIRKDFRLEWMKRAAIDCTYEKNSMRLLTSCPAVDNSKHASTMRRSAPPIPRSGCMTTIFLGLSRVIISAMLTCDGAFHIQNEERSWTVSRKTLFYLRMYGSTSGSTFVRTRTEWSTKVPSYLLPEINRCTKVHVQLLTVRVRVVYLIYKKTEL